MTNSNNHPWGKGFKMKEVTDRKAYYKEKYKHAYFHEANTYLKYHPDRYQHTAECKMDK